MESPFVRAQGDLTDFFGKLILQNPQIIKQRETAEYWIWKLKIVDQLIVSALQFVIQRLYTLLKNS